MARRRKVNERTRRINFPAKRTFFALDIDLHIACGVRIFSARQKRKKEGGGANIFMRMFLRAIEPDDVRKEERSEVGIKKKNLEFVI